MSEAAIEQAILFADVCESTRMYQVLGDEQAQVVIGRVVAIMCEVVGLRQGVVIKTVGDEAMASFPDARAAIDAAMDMQRRLSHFGSPGAGLKPLAIHIGLHWGQVVPRAGDVFGDAVNVAARLRSLSKAGQVLTTGPTLEAAQPLSGVATRLLTRTSVRGRSEDLDVFEVLWEAEDLTSYTPLSAPRAKPSAVLRLRLGAKQVEVGPARPVVTLGRGPQNDLVVLEGCVSRTHAKVEWRKGRFVLVDQSTNGTFLRQGPGKGVYLKLDEAPLEGEGVITLGREGDPDQPQVIHFEHAAADQA